MAYDGGATGPTPTPPPAVGGLGNYKGVMLCNRPPDVDASKSSGLLASGAQPAFKTTVSPTENEVLGLCPSRDRKKFDPQALQVKNRGPSAALRRHCKWLKELQGQVKEDKKAEEAGYAAEQQRMHRMQDAFKAQREVVQAIKSKRDAGELHPEDLVAMMGNMGARKPAAQGPPKKPMWAMTEAEKNDFEEEDAADLIKFAEDLDFENYLGDLEFRQCLQALNGRAKKLQREQDAFKAALVNEFNASADGDSGDEQDNDVSSTRGPGAMRRVRMADGRPDWDASTACGDEAAQAVDKAAKSLANIALEQNSQLGAIHSKASIQRLVKSAQESEAGSERAA